MLFKGEYPLLAAVSCQDAARLLSRGLCSQPQLQVEVAALLQAPVLLDGHLSLAQHLEPQPPLQALQRQRVPASLELVGKQMRGLNEPLQIPQAVNADVSDVMTCREKLGRCGSSREMNRSIFFFKKGFSPFDFCMEIQLEDNATIL